MYKASMTDDCIRKIYTVAGSLVWTRDDDKAAVVVARQHKSTPRKRTAEAY